MHTLYIVGTPIGNLEDISLRALRVLKEVGLVAAEDTRKTRALLEHFEIRTPLTSYFEHNKVGKLGVILDALERSAVALVSEAGMPGLSDPGYELIQAALARQVDVVVVPGPSAVVSALVASGLPSDQFVFVGFMPRKSGERKTFLRSVEREPRTLVAYEAPHRVLESLRDIREVLGNRRISVARELSKLHEEFIRGTLDEAIAHFEQHAPRGEFTYVIAGAARDKERWNEQAIEAELRRLLDDDMTGPDAVRQVSARSGWPRREVYALWLKIKS